MRPLKIISLWAVISLIIASHSAPLRAAPPVHQAGPLVSFPGMEQPPRTIEPYVLGDRVSLTLMSVSPGWQEAPITAEYDLIGWVLEGKIQVNSETTSDLVAVNEAFYIERNTPFLLRNAVPDSVSRYLVFLAPPFDLVVSNPIQDPLVLEKLLNPTPKSP